MFDYSVTPNLHRNLHTWASKMRRNSLRIAPVCPIQAINLTPKHRQNSSDTSSNTSTGHHLKWSAPASKSQLPETSQDRSLDTEASASRSSANAMLTQLKILASLQEKLDCKTQPIDRIASKRMILSYKHGGMPNKSSSLNVLA